MSELPLPTPIDSAERWARFLERLPVHVAYILIAIYLIAFFYPHLRQEDRLSWETERNLILTAWKDSDQRRAEQLGYILAHNNATNADMQRQILALAQAMQTHCGALLDSQRPSR